jgi:hypothetical protein
MTEKMIKAMETLRYFNDAATNEIEFVVSLREQKSSPELAKTANEIGFDPVDSDSDYTSDVIIWCNELTDKLVIVFGEEFRNW